MFQEPVYEYTAEPLPRCPGGWQNVDCRVANEQFERHSTFESRHSAFGESEKTPPGSLSGHFLGEKMYQLIMAELLSIQRADVLADAARRIRKHLGERLAELYALPQYPFPDNGGEVGEEVLPELHLVAVLNPPISVFQELEFTADLTGDLCDRYGFYVSTNLSLVGDELAEQAREEGVRL
jgi:hypothetical protein